MNVICMRLNIIFIALNLTLKQGLGVTQKSRPVLSVTERVSRGKRSLFLSSLSVSLSRVPVHGWITRTSKLREQSSSRSWSPAVDDPEYLTHQSSI